MYKLLALVIATLFNISLYDKLHTNCSEITDYVSTQYYAIHQSGFQCKRRPWWIDFTTIQERVSCCPPKHFILSRAGMRTCHPWLNCKDLNSIALKELIGYGAVKAVYRAKWEDFDVAISILNNVEYKDDFQHGLRMIKLLNPSPYVVQFIGNCEEENVFLTEYHSRGNAVNISSLFAIGNDNIIFRLGLCLNYAQLLKYLHNSPIGTRVFCDTNDLTKLLSQLLVTNEYTLLLNDLDALPAVTESNHFSIKCGHREITSSFVAPEQLWPNAGSFVDEEMPGYDEKTDIWKAAAVCEHFVGNLGDQDVTRNRLFSLHESCRNVDSTMRPTAQALVTEYTNIINELQKYYQQKRYS